MIMQVEMNFSMTNFRGMHIIRKNSQIYVPRKFVQVQYLYGYRKTASH